MDGSGIFYTFLVGISQLSYLILFIELQSSAKEMVQNHGGLEDFPSSQRQPSSTATFNRFASNWTITGPSGLNTGEFLQAVHQAAAALRNDNEMTGSMARGEPTRCAH